MYMAIDVCYGEKFIKAIFSGIWFYSLNFSGFGDLASFALYVCTHEGFMKNDRSQRFIRISSSSATHDLFSEIEVNNQKTSKILCNSPYMCSLQCEAFSNLMLNFILCHLLFLPALEFFFLLTFHISQFIYELYCVHLTLFAGSHSL